MASHIVEQRIRSSRRWMRKAPKRRTCEAAYSDLLLATRDFGVARGYVDAAPREVRAKYSVTLAKLEEELLATSHNLRPKCRK